MDIDIVTKKIWTSEVSGAGAIWPSLDVSVGHVDSAIQSHYLYYTIWSYYRGMPNFMNLHDGVAAYNGTSKF